MSAGRSRLAWLALGVLAAAACERAAPPSASAVSGASGSDPATPLDGGASPAAPFDVGEIKTAAEYRSDPELAGADVKRGQALSLACAACHTFGAGEPKIIGPNLHGVFGRPAASADFEYSAALRASKLVWTPRALEAWLADPASFVGGTTMTFTGYRSATDRRDLIAYLLRATD